MNKHLIEICFLGIDLVKYDKHSIENKMKEVSEVEAGGLSFSKMIIFQLEINK